MDRLTKEQKKAIKILQWLHDNTFLFRSTEEDVKFATEYAINVIKAIPSAEPYKGITNGEVMDKLFPEISERLYDDIFTEDWWNSPYKTQERGNKE